MRRAYLRRNPLCVHCHEKGIVEAATELDHIVPLHRNPDDFWNFETGVQGLCTACHQAKTAKEHHTKSDLRIRQEKRFEKARLLRAKMREAQACRS